jgi:tetratricopeptide (TPR) repeat protein
MRGPRWYLVARLGLGAVLIAASGASAQVPRPDSVRAPTREIEITITPDAKQLRRLESLGLLHYAQGDLDQAEEVFKQALAVAEKLSAGYNADLVRSLSNLGWLYQAQDRPSEAEAVLTRVLALEERVGGTNRIELAAALEELAQLYDSQGKYTAATPLFERSLVIRRRVRPNDARTGEAIALLALNRQALGREAEAESLYRQALRVLEIGPTKQGPEAARTLINLAWLYHSQGKHADSRIAFEKALDIAGKMHDRRSLHTAYMFGNYSILLQRGAVAGPVEDAEADSAR